MYGKTKCKKRHDQIHVFPKFPTVLCRTLFSAHDINHIINNIALPPPIHTHLRLSSARTYQHAGIRDAAAELAEDVRTYAAVSRLGFLPFAGASTGGAAASDRGQRGSMGEREANTAALRAQNRANDERNANGAGDGFVNGEWRQENS